MADRQHETTRRKPNDDEVLLHFLRPIVRRFLRVARPEAFRTEESMQQTFRYRRMGTDNNDEDDRSGQVLVTA